MRGLSIQECQCILNPGIDVSRLFSDMVMAAHTNDVVQKKMIYLYLVNYAEANSELAILTINTLQKVSMFFKFLLPAAPISCLCRNASASE